MFSHPLVDDLQLLTLLVYSMKPGGRVRCMSMVITMLLGSWNGEQYDDVIEEVTVLT